jgi:hypothetical protein
LATILVWRYDDQDYPNGRIAASRGDHFAGLTGVQKAAELAIGAAKPDGLKVRSTSLYVWVDQVVAEKLWKLSKKKYLYELEVDQADIHHKGDVNCYSAAMDAIAAGRPPTDPVDRYWRGDDEPPPYYDPRIEMLVSHAKVMKKIKP